MLLPTQSTFQMLTLLHVDILIILTYLSQSPPENSRKPPSLSLSSSPVSPDVLGKSNGQFRLP